MNIKKIQELIELMNNNDLAQIEIEKEGTKIKLVKNGTGVVERMVSAAPAAVANALAQGTDGADKPTGNQKEMKSPMVGTFYKAPSPDVAAYVEVGDVVKKGDVLCIVEAMKLMNEVKSEFNGKIVKICVENAEPVEFDQTIFIIEPV